MVISTHFFGVSHSTGKLLLLGFNFENSASIMVMHYINDVIDREIRLSGILHSACQDFLCTQLKIHAGYALFKDITFSITCPYLKLLRWGI